jgi:hypothetical protein
MEFASLLRMLTIALATGVAQEKEGLHSPKVNPSLSGEGAKWQQASIKYPYRNRARYLLAPRPGAYCSRPRQSTEVLASRYSFD